MRHGLSLILLMTFVPPAARAADTQEARGESIVAVYCASCHAIGKTGDSPHIVAPAFRDLHLRYDVGDLEEGLVEGLVSGHPDMPEFSFSPEEADDIIAYLRSLERP